MDPAFVFSPRILATPAPPIPSVRHWASRYGGAAGPLLDLTQAVPGYPPHPALLAKLSEAAGTRATSGYGPIDGEPALREALAADMARAYSADFTGADIAITSGGNLAFTMTMTVLAAGGGRVVLPTPWYFNHRMALEMLGAQVVPLPCRAGDGFVPDPDAAAPLLDGARALVLVTPNNPTGATYSPETIARFAALCRARGVWLVLDETYREFLDPVAPPHALFSDAAWRDHVIHLYSFSKAYCVPGHRIGAIASGQRFRAELMKALDTLQICAPRAAQTALSWAVDGLRDWRSANRDVMGGRAAAARAALSQLPGWQLDALGAYFAYLRLPENEPDSVSVAERLAVERGLLALPGGFFGPGQERHIRLAFANANEVTIAAVPTRLIG